MCVMLHVHLPLIKINAFWQNLYYSTQRIWFNKTSMIKILIFFSHLNKQRKNTEVEKWYTCALYTSTIVGRIFLQFHPKMLLAGIESIMGLFKKGYTRYTHLHFASVFHILQATLYYAIDNKTICVSFIWQKNSRKIFTRPVIFQRKQLWILY